MLTGCSVCIHLQLFSLQTKTKTYLSGMCELVGVSLITIKSKNWNLHVLVHCADKTSVMDVKVSTPRPVSRLIFDGLRTSGLETVQDTLRSDAFSNQTSMTSLLHLVYLLILNFVFSAASAISLFAIQNKYASLFKVSKPIFDGLSLEASGLINTSAWV